MVLYSNQRTAPIKNNTPLGGGENNLVRIRDTQRMNIETIVVADIQDLGEPSLLKVSVVGQPARGKADREFRKPFIEVATPVAVEHTLEGVEHKHPDEFDFGGGLGEVNGAN